MEEATKAYFENPNLVYALTVAVIALGLALVWIVRWVLNKLLPVLERNTKAYEAVMFYMREKDKEYVAHQNEVIEALTNNTNVIKEFSTEHRVLVEQLRGMRK